jgi:hypothetical protein
MQSISTGRSRRRFLKQLGMVAGAGALLALGPEHKTRADDGAERPAANPSGGRGYRLTAHIRSYYRKADL